MVDGQNKVYKQINGQTNFQEKSAKARHFVCN